MQTQTVTIQGSQFTIPAPFMAGHVVNDNQAAALNQLFAENIRNNFASKMKSAKEKGEPIPGQTELDRYAASYEFGVRATPAAKLSPVEREARAIAAAEVDRLLKAQSIAKKSLPEGKYDELIDRLLAKYPAIMEQAEKIVAARTSVIEDSEITLD